MSQPQIGIKAKKTAKVVVVVVKLFIFVSHVKKHSIQFILAKTYMTLSRCSAYETHDKLLGKILSSIIHSKNKLGERI